MEEQVHVARAGSPVSQSKLFPPSDSSLTHQTCAPLIQMASDHLERLFVSDLLHGKRVCRENRELLCIPTLPSVPVDVQSVSACRSRWFRQRDASICDGGGLGFHAAAPPRQLLSAVEDAVRDARRDTIRYIHRSCDTV